MAGLLAGCHNEKGREMTQDKTTSAGNLPPGGIDLAAAAEAARRTLRADFRIIGILTDTLEFKGTNARGEYAMHSVSISLMGDGFEVGLRGRNEKAVYEQALGLRDRIVQLRGRLVKSQGREHRHCFELEVISIEPFAGV